MGIRSRDFCREYFKRLKILPLQSQYLLSLLLFVAENTDYFRSNAEIHGFNTKNKCNLHLPPTKLTIFQRGPYYSGIKAFNNLPTYIKNLLQTKKKNSNGP
jgi:arginine/lysine/ornithine decarboxylase